MANTENTTIETVETKPKRKHLLAEIEQLQEKIKSLESDLKYKGHAVENLEREILQLKAKNTALLAYVAGVKGDALPDSEDK